MIRSSNVIMKTKKRKPRLRIDMHCPGNREILHVMELTRCGLCRASIPTPVQEWPPAREIVHGGNEKRRRKGYVSGLSILGTVTFTLVLWRLPYDVPSASSKSRTEDVTHLFTMANLCTSSFFFSTSLSPLITANTSRAKRSSICFPLRRAAAPNIH